MIRGILVLLVIAFAIAVAPTAAADETSEAGGDDCVYTSTSYGKPGVGVNPSYCLDRVISDSPA